MGRGDTISSYKNIRIRKRIQRANLNSLSSTREKLNSKLSISFKRFNQLPII